MPTLNVFWKPLVFDDSNFACESYNFCSQISLQSVKIVPTYFARRTCDKTIFCKDQKKFCKFLRIIFSFALRRKAFTFHENLFNKLEGWYIAWPNERSKITFTHTTLSRIITLNRMESVEQSRIFALSERAADDRAVQKKFWFYIWIADNTRRNVLTTRQSVYI